MQPVTYQQLLSQHYEESARNVLVSNQDFDDTPVDAHETSVGMALENPEDFNKFGGARGDGELVVKSNVFEDKGKGSVRYSKDVSTNIFAIDSRFRSYAVPGIPSLPATLLKNSGNITNTITSTATSLSSDFIFRIQKLTRNVISAKLTSFELPNTFFNIQDIRNNGYFSIGVGNCSSITPLTKVKVLTIDTSKTSISCSNYSQGADGQPNGFYYSNTNIIPAINAALSSTITPPLSIIDMTPIIGDRTGTITTTIKVSSTVGLVDGAYVSLSGISIYKNSTITVLADLSGPYLISSLTQIDPTIWSFYITIPVPGWQASPSTAQYRYVVSPSASVRVVKHGNSPVTYLSQDLSVTSSNGYFQLNNSSQNTYTINFTPNIQDANTTHPISIFSTLGHLLGFNSYTYDINPYTPTPLPPSSFDCGQITACQCYGVLTSEDQIDMNADPYIYLSIADWSNVEHQTVNDSFFTAFARIPVSLPKGQMVYDNLTNSTVTKIYYFKQPSNFQQFEVKLLDMTGNLLLMPNTNWSMVLELEEVISQALYEKLREL